AGVDGRSGKARRRTAAGRAGRPGAAASGHALRFLRCADGALSQPSDAIETALNVMTYRTIHATTYRYDESVSQSISEARLTPRASEKQRVLEVGIAV